MMGFNKSEDSIKKLPSGHYKHAASGVVFPSKPPNWILPYLDNLHEKSYKAGVDSVRESLLEVLGIIKADPYGGFL